MAETFSAQRSNLFSGIDLAEIFHIDIFLIKKFREVIVDSREVAATVIKY